ncbi:reverse transcriptase domain-containing protein [Tanacetum coccineum]|uniref:Reverse transcriptase domain-containing protein n=1 Tax=Tanacetum coccineum TaxID=301880 RepID=A0ABQ5B633_9ASTR
MREDSSTQVKLSRSNDTLRERKSREEQEAPEAKTPKNLGTKTDIWKLYTDGASNEHESGAGLILIDPEGAEYSYALRLNFANSNNDAEYEALLAGLRIATKIKVEKMHAFVDSKLVASQVEGSYEADSEKTKKCKEKALEMIRSFNNFQISHIPREDNKRVDTLSKLTAVQCDEYQDKRCFVYLLIYGIIRMDQDVLIGVIRGKLIQKLLLNQKCMGYLVRAYYIISPTRYYKDDLCWSADLKSKTTEDIMSIRSFMEVLVLNRYVLVRKILFGTPATIITENGTQLINDPFKSWAEGLGIKLISTSVYHPQENGAVERANRSIMQGIKTRLHQEGGAWVEELLNVLWAHRTTPKTNNGETQFSLAYGTEAVILVEIGIPTRRTI